MPNEIETEEHEYPNIVERFTEVLKKLGIKKHEALVDHCAKGDLEDLEDVEQKLYEMGLHPSLRNQVVNFWAADIKQPVPQKLQKRLAEEKGTKARKPEGEEEAREPEKYSVDTDTGAIKVASTTDKKALTWDEAEKLSKDIKKGIEARGGPADPLEILAKQAQSLETMRSVFGGGEGGKGPLDSVEDLIKLKALLGADDDTKALLSGIYKTLSEGGAKKGESEEVKGLREDVRGLREELERKERERLEGQITNLNTAMTQMRADLARARTEASATDEYGIMSEAIKVVDRRLGALEGTVRGVFGKPPGLLPPGAKTELTQAISEEAVAEQAIDALAEKIFYQQ